MVNKPSHLFINIIFFMILILGVLISGFIYHTGSQIGENTQGLLTKKIPTYEVLKQLSNNITEQERFLYEFYATEDEQKFDQAFVVTKGRIEEQLLQLKQQFGEDKSLIITQTQLDEFHRVADHFIQNIRSSETDWSLAREQLAHISEVRLLITPNIYDLIEQTKNKVQQAERQILRDLGKVNFFVVFYALATLFIVYSVVRAWKAYLASTAHNERLSLFPKRNPNPVISLDVQNNVTFSNPACDKFLDKMGQERGRITHLLSPNLAHYQQTVLTEENIDSIMFEYNVDGFYLQCEIHWLADQKQWDIHLTDITARKQVEQELEYRASHDPDTGLRKRYELEKRVDELHQQQQAFSFGLVEVRSYGQLVSSRGLSDASIVVKEVGLHLQAVMKSLCESECEAFRVGEKSFALISLAFINKEQIEELVQKIEAYISLQAFYGQYQVKLDFGFASYPEHGESYAALHINAMAALDKSARSDNKRYVVFDPELGQKLAYQQQLITDLKVAIENKHFELYFQPQQSLVTEKLIGAEVLLRWQRGADWVSPAEFIPLAESAGLIVELGDWILQTACEKAREYTKIEQNKDLVFAVNISPVQFTRPDFLAKVQNILTQTGLAPKNLELEITEGVIIYNEQETIETLKALSHLGVQLAIDDFGTGYSSLSYLKNFSIDKLKIDQSFIRHLQHEPADQSIVRTIIELGRNLNLQLIAEGVEEVQQKQLLQDYGCDEIQGYLYSKPLPQAEFNEFLNRQSVRT